MDLGLAGRRAIVCASSKGLGRGCARALAAEGVDIVVNGRDARTLAETAARIRAASGVDVKEVAADVATEQGRDALLAACPDPDILVNNAGGPPPGDFRDWSRDTWIAALDANMLAPIALIRAVVDGMMQRGFGRIVNITSAAVRAPIPNLGLSNGARAGLTGFVAALARETVARDVTINNLLPGPFATDRLRRTVASRRRGDESEDDALAREAQANPARRFGRPEELGAACAFLCSIHAGYVTGQNLLMDGGGFRGAT